jgi:hypothetical protein
MGEPELVTRQCGVSSTSRHLGFAPALRQFVDKANIIRKFAFLLLALYYNAAAADVGGAPVLKPTATFSDNLFRLLTDDFDPGDQRLREQATRLRTLIAQEHPNGLSRSGAIGRVGQSFRSNIQTAIVNYFNQPYSLQKSYLIAYYDLTYHESKTISARLGRSKYEVHQLVRKTYEIKLISAEHIALEGLNADNLSSDRRETLIKNYSDVQEARQRLRDDHQLLPREAWDSFDQKFKMPDARDNIDFEAIWQEEYVALPDTDNVFEELFANYARMADVCRGVVCARKFPLSPGAGFATDFVPMDKETLRLALVEMRTGQHGASLDFQAFLRNSLAEADQWGLEVAFSARKLQKLHTGKHVIDGQLLTDGVRVILPMRTRAASAAIAEAAQRSAFSRSSDGKRHFAEQFLPAEEYEEMCLMSDFCDDMGAKQSYREFDQIDKKMFQLRVKTFEAKAIKMKNDKAELDFKSAKASEREAAKRDRDAKTKEEKDAERDMKAAGKKSKRDDPNPHIQPPPNTGPAHFITGVDTGHCFPVVAARKAYDADEFERPEFYTLSIGQWYHGAGQKRRQRFLKQKVKRGALPQVPTLSATGEELWCSVEFRVHNYNRFVAVYGSVAVRREQFNCYIKKQRMLRQVAKKLIPDDHTTLAWGDGDFSTSRKGLAASVHKAIERYIKTNFKDHIRVTPEHRSSKLCSCCQMPMKNLVHGHIKRRNGQPHLTTARPDGRLIPREIHGVMQCQTAHCLVRWHRDKNAAINIRNIYISICKTRKPPLHYRRGFKFDAPETAPTEQMEEGH